MKTGAVEHLQGKILWDDYAFVVASFAAGTFLRFEAGEDASVPIGAQRLDATVQMVVRRETDIAMVVLDAKSGPALRPGQTATVFLGPE